MKTNVCTIVRRSAIALTLGALATLTYAGPGPQYWNRPATAAPKESKEPAASPAKCPGCKTVVKWVTGDRGPAGKGVPGSSVAGKTHTCTFCTGATTTEKGTTTHAMTHANPCAQMRCCNRAS